MKRLLFIATVILFSFAAQKAYTQTPICKTSSAEVVECEATEAVEMTCDSAVEEIYASCTSTTIGFWIIILIGIPAVLITIALIVILIVKSNRRNNELSKLKAENKRLLQEQELARLREENERLRNNMR